MTKSASRERSLVCCMVTPLVGLAERESGAAGCPCALGRAPGLSRQMAGLGGLEQPLARNPCAVSTAAADCRQEGAAAFAAFCPASFPQQALCL